MNTKSKICFDIGMEQQNKILQHSCRITTFTNRGTACMAIELQLLGFGDCFTSSSRLKLWLVGLVLIIIKNCWFCLYKAMTPQGTKYQNTALIFSYLMTITCSTIFRFELLFTFNWFSHKVGQLGNIAPD